MGRASFFDASAWEQFWHGNAVPSDPLPLEAFVRALRPLMEGTDFRGFRNGGIPLFERRLEHFTQEILVVPGPPIEGKGTVNLRVHVSLPALREQRLRYWTIPYNAPSLVAGGDVCLLDVPPAHAVWTLDAEGADAAIAFLRDTVVPWMNGFEDFAGLALAFEQGGYPLITLPASVELVCCFFGRSEARRFLRLALDGSGLSARDRIFLERVGLTLGLIRPRWSTA